MPTKVMSACAASASVGWISGWPCSASRSGRRRGDRRQRHRERACLDAVRHREDDVVEGGRTVRRDVAGQRNDLVLRAVHRRKLLDRRLQRAPRADRHHQRFRRVQPPFDLGGLWPRRRPAVVDDEFGSLGTTSTRSSAKRARSFAASSRQLAMGWSSDADEAFRHRQRHQALRRLARNAELGGDLVLRVAGDIIQPPGARRVVQPCVAAVLPDTHRRDAPSILPVSQGTRPSAIVISSGHLPDKWARAIRCTWLLPVVYLAGQSLYDGMRGTMR